MAFLYTLTGGDKKTEGEKKVNFLSVYKSRMLLKNIWVLVFSFMYLVSVDPMDRSFIYSYVLKLS